jgi:O-acetyl-ADP-ribose deacetylase (regulator of RNase III)
VKFDEARMDLFDVDESYHLAHCIATDLCMGKGIAVPMNERFDLRRQMREIDQARLLHPTCVLTGRVFNLITKSRSWDKPTPEHFLASLRKMRDMCVEKGVGRLAMPRLGCGLDRLPWPSVRDAVKKEFFETDVEVLVCVR